MAEVPDAFHEKTIQPVPSHTLRIFPPKLPSPRSYGSEVLLIYFGCLTLGL